LPRKENTMRLGRRIIAILAGLALLPLLFVFLAAALAALLRCEVSDIGPVQCTVFGTDIGGGLHAALTAGWLSLITIPLLMLIVSAWALLEIFIWRRKRRKARRAVQQSIA
jgi:hypothetical protein